MWTIFKVFIEFVIRLLPFYGADLLALKHMGSEFPNQGLNPYPLHWKAKS